MLARIRKAIIAGLGAMLASVGAAYVQQAPTNSTEWITLAFAALGAGVIVGFATWRVPNAPVTVPARFSDSGDVRPRPDRPLRGGTDR
jgi:hypothetical protein